MNNDVKELREALDIVKLAPRLDKVVKKLERIADERFDGTKDNKALSKKGVLSEVQKQNTKE
jgi:hypothetical protein